MQVTYALLLLRSRERANGAAPGYFFADWFIRALLAQNLHRTKVGTILAVELESILASILVNEKEWLFKWGGIPLVGAPAQLTLDTITRRHYNFSAHIQPGFGRRFDLIHAVPIIE